MPLHLRSALPAGVRPGTRRTMPVAVLLVAVVILVAGIGGVSDFAGARWFPHFHGGYAGGPRIGTTGPMVTITTSRHRLRNAAGGVPTWLLVTLLALVAVALVGLAVFLWRQWRGRHRLPGAVEIARPSVQLTTERMVEPEPAPEPEQLLTGIGLALEVLDEEREPADAVVRAWLGLQETAQESGIVRRASETPTEFTARILRGAFADDRAVRTLLRLYLRARFGDHPVTAQDVVEVREALQELVSSWRPTAGTRATRARR